MSDLPTYTNFFELENFTQEIKDNNASFLSKFVLKSRSFDLKVFERDFDHLASSIGILGVGAFSKTNDGYFSSITKVEVNIDIQPETAIFITKVIKGELPEYLSGLISVVDSYSEKGFTGAGYYLFSANQGILKRDELKTKDYFQCALNDYITL